MPPCDHSNALNCFCFRQATFAYPAPAHAYVQLNPRAAQEPNHQPYGMLNAGPSGIPYPFIAPQPLRQPVPATPRRIPFQAPADSPAQNTRAKKRTNTSADDRSNKRPKTSHAPAVPNTAVSLLQPTRLTTLPAQVPPTAPAVSQLHRSKGKDRGGATDVWYFYAILDDESPHPTPLPPPDFPDKPFPRHKWLMQRPKCVWLLCTLCSDKGLWTPYQLSSNTGTLRDHLVTHGEAWTSVRDKLGLKNAGSSTPSPDVQPPKLREAFTKAGFMDCLIKWIAATDQSLNAVEAPEFRKLLEYCNPNLDDTNWLPHRTRLTEALVQKYVSKREEIKQDLKTCLGLVHCTSDIWTDPNQVSYMAITAHFIVDLNGLLTIRTRLLAFEHLKGSHTGAYLATIQYKVLQWFNILHKLGVFTLDNASNNTTCMASLSSLLGLQHIDWNAKQNCIRCFPHVVNLGAQEITDRGAPKEIIKKVRDIIATCRSSGLRREALAEVIKDGNKAERWTRNGEPWCMPEVQLLRDCETRWSSTFMMIDRFIDLFPAIQHWLAERPDINCTLLTQEELEILADVHDVLIVPHLAQEGLSAQASPTLAHSLPLYERILISWRSCSTEYKDLASVINLAIQKVEKYVNIAWRTDIYALAMVSRIGPVLKGTGRHA